MTFTNIDTSLTIPSGAGPNDPQIFLGDQIPTELATFYNDAFRSVVAVQLFRLDSRAYGYEAIIVYNNGNVPYRAAGVVNLDRVDFPVIEFTAYYLPDTGNGVMYVGGFSVGGTGSPESQVLKAIVNRQAEFNYPTTFWDGITAQGISASTLIVGGSIDASGIVYHTAYSGTTDASGFLTVTHGAPWTPVAGWYITTNPSGSFAAPWGIDTITATTCRLRIQNVAGTGALASTAVSGRLFLVK